MFDIYGASNCAGTSLDFHGEYYIAIVGADSLCASIWIHAIDFLQLYVGSGLVVLDLIGYKLNVVYLPCNCYI